jgi:polar amino acid transport system substrate-binding protein
MDTLRVGALGTDPPFAGMVGGGFDVDLAAAMGAALGLSVERVAPEDSDVDDLLSSLAAGAYDCVVAAVIVTAQRQHTAAFTPPYLVSGHALAVNTARHPAVRSVDDLGGLVVAVRRGSTGHALARQLHAEGRVGAVRCFTNDDIGSAAGELEADDCDAMMALAPTLTELVRSLPDVDVVQRGLSREEIAIAVAPGDSALLAQIATAQDRLEVDGSLQDLRRKWLGNPYRDQSLAAH